MYTHEKNKVYFNATTSKYGMKSIEMYKVLYSYTHLALSGGCIGPNIAVYYEGAAKCSVTRAFSHDMHDCHI